MFRPQGRKLTLARIEFEGKNAAELQNNPMIKRYYLGA